MDERRFPMEGWQLLENMAKNKAKLMLI